METHLGNRHRCWKKECATTPCQNRGGEIAHCIPTNYGQFSFSPHATLRLPCVDLGGGNGRTGLRGLSTHRQETARGAGGKLGSCITATPEAEAFGTGRISSTSRTTGGGGGGGPWHDPGAASQRHKHKHKHEHEHKHKHEHAHEHADVIAGAAPHLCCGSGAPHRVRQAGCTRLMCDEG